VTVIKILVISHNPFSTYQSMGKTFMSLFSDFKKEELCQLYIYPSFPNVDMVNSCYRITDRDAIKSILPLKSVGSEVTVHEYKGEMIENKADGKFYAKSSNNVPLKRLLRDGIWRLSHWYSKKLKVWLEKESPDVIFLAPGYAKFIYNIALKISKKRNIPIVTYICDDYYFLDKPKNFLGLYQHKLLQKKTLQTMNATSVMISISEEIQKKYADAFNLKTALIMTGSDLKISDNVVIKEKLCGFSYFGNVGINREIPLADIGRVLDEINNENNTDYSLNIYTKMQNEAINAAFSGIKSIKMCGFLVGDEFIKEFSNSDCLVHVEAFDNDSIDLVKGSISTKIADSLASGIPLLAYAPEVIASIEHLKRNNCAFIANDYNSLKLAVCEIINNKEKRESIAKTALKVAEEYHNSVENSKRLRNIFEEICEKV